MQSAGSTISSAESERGVKVLKNHEEADCPSWFYRGVHTPLSRREEEGR